MKLSEMQQEFTECAAELILFARGNGFKLTFGDAYRDPRVHGAVGEKKSYSSANSTHKSRLAIDLNLFVDGKYISDGNCDEYKLLGAYWKASHPLARWGGDFNDANHFSFTYGGAS